MPGGGAGRSFNPDDILAAGPVGDPHRASARIGYRGLPDGPARTDEPGDRVLGGRDARRGIGWSRHARPPLARTTGQGWSRPDEALDTLAACVPIRPRNPQCK